MEYCNFEFWYQLENGFPYESSFKKTLQLILSRYFTGDVDTTPIPIQNQEYISCIYHVYIMF